jgi:hypothetical protein
MVLGLTTCEFWFMVAIVIGFFIFGVGGVGYWMYNKRWNKIAVLAEERPPYGIKITGRDRCRLVSLTDTGEEIYILRNSKKYRVFHGHYIDANGKQIGWCKSARDGYFYNFRLGSLDKKLLEMGIMPTSRTARLEQSAMRDIVKNKFAKEDFMQKWGTTISMGLLVIMIMMMIGGAWWLLDKNAETRGIEKQTAELNKEVVSKLDSILSKTDTLQNTGASGLIGLVPANQSG